MHVWPGAVALARRLAEESGGAAGERVLELGCGLGLVALAAARRGAAVTATDWKREPLQFVAASAARNRVAVRVAQMDWTHMATRRCFSLCVGADVAYDAEAETALVDALGRAAASGGRLLLADSVNTHRDTILRRLAASGWETRVDRVLEREEGRSVWVRVIAARRRPGI
jgi:predicted nicotinamide N-methyase